MKKSIYLINLFILCSLIFAGCGSSEANVTATADSALSPTPSMPAPTPESTVKIIQLNNSLPQTDQVPTSFSDLVDNHIGVHSEGYDRWSNTSMVYDAGFKRIRIQALTDFWGEGNELAVFKLESIPPEVDDTISEYVSNDVLIVLDLWVGGGMDPLHADFHKFDGGYIWMYKDYVRFVVSHFKGRIRHYQIWNEPWSIPPRNYVNLIQKTVPVIREVDPDAKIIINGVSGNWEYGFPGYGENQRFSLELSYLEELLQSGVAPLVDGISWHPFYGTLPTDPYYRDYPEFVGKIKEMAEENGFTGEYYADELLWGEPSQEDWTSSPEVSKMVAAKLYTQAITMHRGLDVNVTVNTFFQEPFTEPILNLCNLLAGAEPVEITVSIEGDISQYGFVLPNGDKLVAFWRNGTVVEEDEGEKHTLTVNDSAAKKVVGVDVIQGFEQELTFELVDGNLVVNDLLVKDYPIFLRITP